MITILYDLLWQCAIPFLKRNKRIAIGFAERILTTSLPPACDIWFHAASGGEAKLVAQCIQHMPHQHTMTILITTWTKEGKIILEQLQQTLINNNSPLILHIRYFPFDTKIIMRRFLDAIKPKIVLIAETELWFILFQECSKRAIPFYIINGRLSNKTFTFAPLLRMLFKHCNPTAILAVSNKDRERFQTIFPKSPLSLMNNIKFESINNTEILSENNNPIFLFASIRKKEFPIIAKTIVLLKQYCLQDTLCSRQKENTPDTLTCPRYYIVPRHLHHIQYAQKAFEKQGVEYTLCNSIDELEHACTQVIIINIFGILNRLYSLASAVFVGGSLYKQYGGQNFLESLANGIIPVVGPYRDTFIWAEDGLLEQNLLYPLQKTDPATLAHTLWNAFIHKNDKITVHTQFQQWVQHKQNGSQAIYALLQNINTSSN